MSTRDKRIICDRDGQIYKRSHCYKCWLAEREIAKGRYCRFESGLELKNDDLPKSFLVVQGDTYIFYEDRKEVKRICDRGEAYKEFRRYVESGYKGHVTVVRDAFLCNRVEWVY